MHEEVKFKSDKECYECKMKHRKEIIAEVKQACKKCKKIKKVDRK